jgi:hypothetical protein
VINIIMGFRDMGCYTRGSIGVLPSREARSEAVEHVAAPKPPKVGRRDPEPRDT